MPLLDHFNLIAPHYEEFFPLRNSEKIISLVDLPFQGVLLDAGGGTGRVSQALAGLTSHLVIADISMGMLRQAKRKDSLEAVCTRTEQLPFPAESFHRVIMVDALHHVLDHHSTAQELWRVLKPGGRIVIEEPDIRHFSVKIVAIMEKLALMRSHFISPPHIASLFGDLGAGVRIEAEGSSAWILIDKTPQPVG